VLGLGVVHRDHGVAQDAVGGHGLEADDPGGGFFGAAQDFRQQLLPFGMGGKHQVGAVVHGNLGFDVQGLVDVAVIGVRVFPFDGEGGNAFILDQISGRVVLGAQGVGSAHVTAGAAGF